MFAVIPLLPPALLVSIGAAGDAAASGAPFGWGGGEASMLLCIPVLLVLSGFFSGSETALFGLSEAQRMSFRHGHSIAGRAVDALLDDEGMLLITILLCNTTINVLYFVIGSVLMMRSSAGPLGQSVMAFVFLLLIVLGGEVGPKVLANTSRLRFAALSAPLLLTVHRVIGPLRDALRSLVIAPLSRLTAPQVPPPPVHDDELRALVTVSGEAGVLDRHEQQILDDVLTMRRLKVRDVMTPRVRIAAVATNAARSDVMNLVRETRLTQCPVYRDDLDRIVGMLHAKRYLLETGTDRVTDPKVMTEATFVPDLATLDQLLEHFRRTRTRSAVVVDEHGGTEGIVSIEDVVEELVGDIATSGEAALAPPRLVGLGTWQVSGGLGVHEWADAFRVDIGTPRVATLSGLITERLGHPPAPGDVVRIGHADIEVESVEERRVVHALVRPWSADPTAAPEDST